MLHLKFERPPGDPVEIRVGTDYVVIDDEGTSLGGDVQSIVDGIVERQFHGGSPNLLPLIWSAIKATMPKVKLVRLDPSPESPVKNDDGVPIRY